MKYTEVLFFVEGDSYTHGVVYYGITDADEAIKRFKNEFPEFANHDLKTKTYR